MKYAFACSSIEPAKHAYFIVRVKDQLSAPERMVWDIGAAHCVIRWETLVPVLGRTFRSAQSESDGTP